ncbi:MAG: peptidyl-prolyl cis-trans isomerase [Candidatus Cloacimonetes bacterium]|nr:peptidyl-prolyl cis-trans isomerase [Candidatus Cloacimonadota bacterium]
MTACKEKEVEIEKIKQPEKKAQIEETIPEKPAKDIVVIHTNFGDIKLELFRDKAPISVENFLTYAREKFYDGLIFHRVISNFMIQGGGFDQNCKQKQPTHPPIKNEATNGLSNVRGTIAMARTNQINSATSQFFINVKDNLFLDHKDMGAGFGYAVFGKVIEGMDIVDKIKNVQTGRNPKTGMKDWPKEDVVIESVEIVSE